MCHTSDVQHDGKGHLGTFNISHCLCSGDPTPFSALPLVIQEFCPVVLGSWGQEILPFLSRSMRLSAGQWLQDLVTGCSGLRRARQGVASFPLYASPIEQKKGGRKAVLATRISNACFMAQF